jgi:hypothetical protein
LNGFTPFESDPERLSRILRIAQEQHESLARGDLEAVLELQARRQELTDGIQSLDKQDEGVRDTFAAIRRLDQDLLCLLSSEVIDIKKQMKTVGSLRRLLGTHSPAGNRPPRPLSTRA